MEKLLEQTLLFDFYGELLTEHQKQIYEEVVLDDYSLSEVAQDRGITRQGVHDLIKRCNKILADYEEKLHLVEKFMNIQRLVADIEDCAATSIKEGDKTNYEEAMKKIKNISEEIRKEI
ncbi:MAG: YlxM family DNA-binding protein [Lachnospiraceae bacterium]|nr:YlxM family DNA-binding protein [Lachnospiraceae bacterium]